MTVPVARGSQIDILDGILHSNYYLNPDAIVVYGAPCTGKSHTLRYLANQKWPQKNINVSWVSCDACTTPRIMLQRALREIKRSAGIQSAQLDGVENFSFFASMLADAFRDISYSSAHVLILDRIDQLPESRDDLYHCFSRMSELTGVPNVTVVFVISSLEPRPFLLKAVTHVRFPRYTLPESEAVLSSCNYSPDWVLSAVNNTSSVNTLSVAAQRWAAEANGDGNSMHVDDDSVDKSEDKPTALSDQQWNEYCYLVCTSFYPFCGGNIVLLLDIARKIFPKYHAIQQRLGSNDKVKLYRETRALFTSEWPVKNSLTSNDDISEKQEESDFTLQSKYILCAAYLASYNPPLFDIRFFSQARDARAKRRDTSRRKAWSINPRSLAPPVFDLERMLAILLSIAPPGQILNGSLDVAVQIATLTKLKLILRTSSNDPLDSRTRWKINVSYRLIKQLADELKFPIEEYFIDEFNE